MKRVSLNYNWSTTNRDLTSYYFLPQARERLTSYRGRMTIKLCWTDIQGQKHEMPKDCGLVPIMVRVCIPRYSCSDGYANENIPVSAMQSAIYVRSGVGTTP